MSIPDQQSFATPKQEFNNLFADYTQTLTRGANIVNAQPIIKRQYTPVQPNRLPFFRTDGIKGGFRSQLSQPFSPSLVDRPVGDMFIEEKRLIDRRLNPFLASGDLSGADIARQF